ncbi:LysR family transcriptional regulator [Ferrimonas pelagia]|uniref:LysR family transcriptional regulator n=1 Tax=Ferrimonas pelagia TaxID=1177826 RepID=A0ABP9ENK1_9GAMM
MADFSDLRIGALNTFKVIYEEGSTQRAAERLGHSQSGISYELKKLREIFDDPLFSRCRDGLLPNERAHQLYLGLPKVLAEMENLYNGSTDFHPEQYRGNVRIAILEPLAVAVMPKLYSLFQQHCPHVDLQLMPWNKGTLEQLKRGIIDVGLHLHSVEDDYINNERICPSIRILACRNNHPILKRKQITLMEMCNYPLLLQDLPSWNQQGQSIIEKASQEKKLPLRISARVSYLPAIVPMLQSSNALCYSSAIGLAQFQQQLTLLPAPRELSSHAFHYHCLYPISQAEAPFNLWLRAQLREILAQLMPKIVSNSRER